MKHIRTAIILIVVAFFFIIFTPWMIYCKKLTLKGDEESLKKRDPIADKFVRFMVNNVMVLGGSDVKLYGLENIPDQACVLVGNHQSYFDILALLWKFHPMYGFLAKKEMGKVPFLRTWMEIIDCVFLDRSDARKGMIAVRESINILKRGRSLFIFPEGTRSKNGEIGEFKSGSLLIATKAKVPVVPFLVEGTSELFEKNGYRVKPGKARITFYPPIATDNMTREEVNSLTETVRNELIARQKEQPAL